MTPKLSEGPGLSRRRNMQSSIGSFFKTVTPRSPSPQDSSHLLSPSIPSAPPTPSQSQLTASLRTDNCLAANWAIPPQPLTLSTCAPVPDISITPGLQKSINTKMSDEEEEEAPISRLSRSRTRALRAKRRAQPPVSIPETPPPSSLDDDDEGVAVVMVCDADEERVPKRTEKKKGPQIKRIKLRVLESPASKEQLPVVSDSKEAQKNEKCEKTGQRQMTVPETKPEKRRLHPFFAATAAAVKESRQRTAKRLRVAVSPRDAWNSSSATIHVNAVPPCSSSSSVLQYRHVVETDNVTALPYSISRGDAIGVRAQVRKVERKHHESWAEHYKHDARIDVVNAAASTQLIEWLRSWYQPSKQNEMYSDDSMDSYQPKEENGHRERLAIITGPVGCGKSTLVASVAKQLGLSILEINASVCRSGKKIREIVGDALNTHRVSPSSVFNAFSKSSSQKHVAKTLILFEEVDQLLDDEKGFWSTLQKLANAVDSRRPIVCTANRFDTQMRQILLEPKGTVEGDLERLLIQAGIEQPMSPIEFKHIPLTLRSERQAAVLLSRVAASENVHNRENLIEYLAAVHTSDTRRAINLLQFWADRGLGSKEKEKVKPKSRRRTRSSQSSEVESHPDEFTVGNSGPAGYGYGFLSSLVQEVPKHTLFSLGASSAVLNSTDEGSRKSAIEIDEKQQFNRWCTTLETMTDADVIRGAAVPLGLTRNVDVGSSPDDVCVHEDLGYLESVAASLDEEAFEYALPSLNFPSTSKQLQGVADELSFAGEPMVNRFTSSLPVARKPVETDYLPILQIMAKTHERTSKKSSPNGVEQCVRRTRALTRKRGFFSLDLDPATVTALKRSSLRL